MKAKRITNLYLLDKDKIISDEKGSLYSITNIEYNKQKNECSFSMVQFNQWFSISHLTLPVCCDEKFRFVPIHDKDWNYIFFETNITKKQMCERLIKKPSSTLKCQ